MLRTLIALAICVSGCADPSLGSTTKAVVSNEPWVVHTIANDLRGADGHATADADHDGDADVAVVWEESSRVTVYARPADPRIAPWPLLANYAHSSVEDVTFCDFDGDGWPDLASAGEDKKIRIARNLGGAFAAPVVVALSLIHI